MVTNSRQYSAFSCVRQPFSESFFETFSFHSAVWLTPQGPAVSDQIHFARFAGTGPVCQWLPLWGNSDNRRQWRKQGGAVGAAASRMRAVAKQTLGAATRAVARRRRDGEGKPGTLGPPHGDEQTLLSERYYRCAFASRQRPCPLRRFAPAPPEGEPLACRSSSH